jgi:nucleotidyltransferase/DNA polymerase involved in DNA repair
VFLIFRRNPMTRSQETTQHYTPHATLAAIGIKMGVPVFQIQGLIDREGVVVYSSNYELYGDTSARVMASLREFTEDVEVYSIDEAFIDLRGCRWSGTSSTTNVS